ncbi:hypothetical protein AB0912_21785 [Streptomyces sp. NPDC007084]|uniref:hypothetical protein n=1 Tax=Streptomyces sp. NPDC007084 TaxID=3154313 RepID=UPI00345648C3
MKSYRLTAIAGVAALAACLVTTSPAIAASATASPTAAAQTGCADYTFTASGQLAEGRTATPWSYVISSQPGTINVCLDGPNAADFDLVLKRFAPGGLVTVATSSGQGADKTLSYNGVPSAYRVEVVAISGSGPYSIGVNIP